MGTTCSAPSTAAVALHDLGVGLLPRRVPRRGQEQAVFEKSRIQPAQHHANALVQDEVVRTPLESQQVALEQPEARLNVPTEPPPHQPQQQPNMPRRCSTIVTTFNGTLRVNNTSM